MSQDRQTGSLTRAVEWSVEGFVQDLINSLKRGPAV